MATSRRPPSGRVRRFVVEALEPRLLYSADLGPSLLASALVSPVAEHRLLESEPQAVQPQAAAAQTQAREVVFVDAATPDADRLLADLAAQRGRTIDVVRIGADEDGLARISAELAARRDISAVHIISHGSDAAVYLGRSVVDLQSLETRAGELAAWSDSLTADADVLIYGCDVAQSGAGQALVERLAALTGADVAASTNLTGTAALGGDLELEFRSGAVEAQNVLNAASTLGWQGLLAVTADTSSSASSNTPVTSLTWSHTVSASGPDSFLLVSVATVDGAQPVTSVTYGGTALTQIGGITDTADKVRIELWYLKAPAAGTADVVVNIASATSMSAGATTFFGVDQTTPYSATAFAQGGGGAISVTVASAPGELVVDGAAAQAVSIFNVGANQTELWDQHTGSTPSDPWNASSTEPGAASVTMSWTKAGSGVGHWASGALSLTPAVNSAPVLTGANDLASTTEDASGNAGTSVSSLISGHMTDANVGAPAGIAVTAVDNTNGTWQYSTNGGASWSAFGAPTEGSARLLAADANTYVRFVPNADWSGTVAAGLTFRGWDQATGSAGGTADVSTNGASTAFSAASASSGITVTPVNDAPAGASNTVTTVEDSAFVFSAGDFGFSDVDGNALAAVKITSLPASGALTNNGIAVTAGQLISAADLSAGLLRFTPAAGASGTAYASFTFQVQDDGSTANGGVDLDPTARTMTVNVNPVNNAPVLADANDLAPVLEDGAANGGTLVSDLIAGQVSDADAGASAGIAVVGVDNTNGTWQYSLDAGGSWSSFGAPSAASARLLAADASTYVRFVPNAGWNGTVANGLTFRAWDRSSGVSGGTADTTSATLSVRDEFTADSYANNDGTASWSTSWVDNDGNPAAGQIRATGGELVLSTFLGSGTVYRQVDLSAASGASLSFSYDNQLGLLGTVSLQASSNGGATYSTLASFSSLANPGTGTYTADLSSYLAFNTRVRFVMSGTLLGGSFHVDNVEIAYTTPLSGGTTAFSASTASSSITVAAVNDAPAGASNTVTTLEDTAYVFAAADFGFSDNDGNALAAVRITTVPTAGTLTNNGVAVSAGQAVSAADIAAGLLRFTPAPDANGTGYASFTFQVQDDGGTANGGADLDPTARTMTMNVTAVNDAPLGKNTTVTTLEDTAYIFTASDFGFADADGNALFGVRLVSLPSAGVLTNNGVAVSSGQTVSAADIAAGLFRFTPAANASGAAYASFRFQVRDDGGTANGGVDIGPGAHTMTVNVTAVNDAPSGANNTVTTLEDTGYVFAATDFGFSDTDANALTAVRITSLPASGALTSNGVAVSAGQMVSAADIASGLLRFTPALNGSGAAYASFTFQVQDDGGTGNGGVDVDPTARTMTVNVAAVNDAPAGANNTVTTAEDAPYVFVAADFGFSDADGNALAAVRIATLPGSGTLTNNGVAVSAGQLVSAADIASGLLRFTPTSNANGAGYASFTFQVQDDGGTANGGVDLDPAAHTMTVNVTAVNDAPSGANNIVTTLEDTAYVFAAADFGFTDADGNALAGVRITAVPGAGTLSNNGVAVAAGQLVSTADIAAGLLRFTPTPNANGAGYSSFTFQVQDDGGTANGGVDLDAIARTMTVSVTAVNDAPSGANNTVTLLEDSAYVFAAADFGFSDGDGNALGAVRITALAGAGTLANNGVAVSAGQIVSASDIASGLLRFTPAANGNGTGYAGFSFQVQDDGGTANGGVDVDAIARTMSVNVTAVNDAPTGANTTVILQQDAAYVFSAADFGFSDSDGNALGGVVLSTLPPGGVMTDNGAPVSAGQTVSAANIAAGLVRYTPAVGASGLPYASFTFRVQDSGGTANGGADTDAIARTMTIDVIPALLAGPGTNPVPPAPVQTQAPAPLDPAASGPAEHTPALTAENPSAAASARLLLASNDVLGTRVDVEEGFRAMVAQSPAPVFATAQRLASAIPASSAGLPAGVAGPEDRQLESHLFGSTAVSDRAGGGSRAAGLAGDLDRMRDDMDEQVHLEHWASGSIAVGSFGLTVGYVLWLLRGGALLASLLSSLPAWRLIDPLPVLSRFDEEEDRDEDEDAFVSFEEANPPFPVMTEKA